MAVRYAYDEEMALAAVHPGASGVWARSTSLSDECRVEGDDITIYDEGGHDAAKAEHIARHDPARVLAGIKAKRAVVRQHCDTDGHCDLCCHTLSGEPEPYEYPCPTLYALLQEFADREDFPDEWRTA